MTSTVVTLPNYPAPLTATLRKISYASDLVGPLGGQDQRVLRLGTRFALDLAYPPMPYDVGRQWLARINAAEAFPAAVRFPQRGFQPIAPGALVIAAAASPINTGGQIGVHLGAPGFVLVEGQFFHITSQTNGRRYVHQVVGDTILDGDGATTIGIQPLLRFQPLAGDVLEFVNPTLEGFIQGNKTEWTIEMARRVGIKFSIKEDR